MPITISVGDQPLFEALASWAQQGPHIFAINIFLNGGYIFFIFSVLRVLLSQNLIKGNGYRGEEAVGDGSN